jgi:hypothetical protein
VCFCAFIATCDNALVISAEHVRVIVTCDKVRDEGVCLCAFVLSLLHVTTHW